MKIEQLTIFRFIAASIVVIFHYGQESTGLKGIFISGQEMVAFFFVLSGFVLTISYLNKDFSTMFFYWSRLARIMPVYLLALLLVTLAFLIKGTSIDAKALLLNATLLQSWISPYPLTLNTPGWSLSVEAFFYLLFPLVLKSIKTNSTTPGKLIFLTTILWITSNTILTTTLNSGLYTGFPSYHHDIIHYFPPSHLSSFLFGICGAIWFYNRKPKIQSKLSAVISISSIVFIIIILDNKELIMNFLNMKLAFGSSLMAPLYIVFITSIAIAKSSFIKFLKYKPLVLLGESSYSLYILQTPVHQIYKNYISWLLPLTPKEDFWLYFLMLVIISIATFLLFEKPAKEYLRPLCNRSIKKINQ